MGSVLTTPAGRKRVLLAVAAYLVYRYIRKRMLNRPPGPWPAPIIGNFYLAEPDKKTGTPPMHLIMMKLAQKFGPIFSFWFGSQYTVVLSSPKAVHEALLVNGDKTAGRNVVQSMDIITGGMGIALQPDLARWKKFRNALVGAVTAKRQGETSESTILDECHDMVYYVRENFARTGTEFEPRLQTKRESLNVLMRLVCGFRFGADMSDEYRAVEQSITQIFERISAGNPSDYIPLAKYSSGSKTFVKELQAAVDSRDAYIDAWVAEHKRALARKPAGEPPQDFVDHMLQQQATSGMTDHDIRSIIWDCMAGGIDTSATSFEWLVYILVNYPDVQAKIHEELDRVVGDDALPTYEHHGKLVYLNAVICELFRYKHFAPFGIPHATLGDVKLGGYDVPKDAQLMINFHALHNDPDLWDEPEEFRPERFLEEDRAVADNFLHPDTVRNKAKTDPSVFKFLPYGFGKRMCVGWGLGRIIMFMKCATHLHCFRWAAKQDIDIDTEFFGVTLVPESQKVMVEERPAARLVKAPTSFGPTR